MAGTGHYWLALFVTLLTIIDLELRYTPVLNRLEAHRYADRMSDDTDDDESGSGPGA